MPNFTNIFVDFFNEINKDINLIKHTSLEDENKYCVTFNVEFDIDNKFKNNMSTLSNNLQNFNYSEFISLFEEITVQINSSKNSVSAHINTDLNNANLQEFIDDIKNYFDVNENIPNVDICLTIWKKKLFSNINSHNYFICCYFEKEKFLDYISKLSLYYYDNLLSKHDKILFICLFNENYDINNNYIAIYSSNNKDKIIDYLINNMKNYSYQNNNEKIDFRNEHINSIKRFNKLLPEAFLYRYNTNEYNELYMIMQNNLFKTCILFLANYIDIENNEDISIFSGNKKIKIILNKTIALSELEYMAIYHSYKLIYESLSYDKLLMFRTIVSMQLCNECNNNLYLLLSKCIENIYETFEKDYEKYIQSNIEQYMSTKNTYFELLENIENNISKSINTITENINKTFISLLGTIIIAVFTTMQSIEIQYVKYLSVLFIAYLVINFAYVNIYACVDVYNNVKKYKEYLNIYNNFLSTKEKKEYINTNVKNYVISFKIYTLFSFLIYLGLIILSIKIFFNPTLVEAFIKQVNN